MRRRSPGISLLEILVAMLLFFMAMTSFAMVFRSGFRMNLKSYRENQGVDLANAILQEVASKSFYTYSTDHVSDSLYNIATGWSGECPRSSNIPQCDCGSNIRWTPESLCGFYQKNPGLASRYNYRLPSNGIQISFLSTRYSGMRATPTNDNPLVQITVHLNWQDDRVLRTVTLSTFSTNNKLKVLSSYGH